MLSRSIFESEDIFKYGDLRLQSTLVARNINVSETSKYSGSMLYNGKWDNKSYVTLFRGPVVYLRYAEALNRAGYPESAFAILKYGLNNDNNAKYISENERNRAGNLLNFNINYFTENNTQGSRSRGCGDAAADTTFVLPMPASELGSYLDTVEYQIPLVEEMIFDELALETCFEGLRFGDLIRYSVRRNDNSYLARKVASRNGEDELDGALFGLLQDRSKWYLTLE